MTTAADDQKTNDDSVPFPRICAGVIALTIAFPLAAVAGVGFLIGKLYEDKTDGQRQRTQ